MSNIKIDVIDFNDELNECLRCGYTSTSFAELYDENGDEITAWNSENNVVCPKCKSFDYYIKDKIEEKS
tara:strand:- start:97 stop:303 length:207 start_codon:yes stop_codon:yes gene_type:complete